MTQHRQTTLALLGLFGSPNFGNEATLEAFVHNVSHRLPHARFVCVAARQSDAQSKYGFPLLDLAPHPSAQHFWRVRPPWLRELCEFTMQRLTEPARLRYAGHLLHQMDVTALVMPGTGIIDDFGQRPQDMPTHLDRWTRAARAYDIPVCYVSVGVSTVQNRDSRTLFRRALGRADYCSFRDTTSMLNAHDLGYDSADGVCADLAFSLPASLLLQAGATRQARCTIGVGVMGYYGWNRPPTEGQRLYEAYLHKLCALVQQLMVEGYDVRLLSGDARADNRCVQDVMRVLQACSTPDMSHGKLTAPAIANHHDVLREIGNCDLVVATRFHNVLLSLLLQRPTVSIGYADKNDALMADFGLQHYCHNIETLDVQAVLQQLRDLAARPEAVLARLPPLLAKARLQLEGQYDLLCERLSQLSARPRIRAAAAV